MKQNSPIKKKTILLLTTLSIVAFVVVCRRASVTSLQWEHKFEHYYALSTPIFNQARNLIYVTALATEGEEEVRTFAIDAATGKERWYFSTSAENPTVLFMGRRGGCLSPALGPDGLIIVGPYEDRLYALDALTGAKRWEFSKKGLYYPLAVGSSGIVYCRVTLGSSEICAIDGRTGQLRWEFTRVPHASVVDYAVAKDGTVFIGWSDKTISLIDGQTGALKSEYPITFGMGKDVSGFTLAVSTNGILRIMRFEGQCIVLDAFSGHEKWNLSLRGFWDCSLDVDGEELVFCNDGNIEAYDADSGKKLWNRYLGQGLGPLCMVNNEIYVAFTFFKGEKSKVYLFDKHTGTEAKSYIIGSNLGMPLISGDGSIYVCSADSVYAIKK